MFGLFNWGLKDPLERELFSWEKGRRDLFTMRDLLNSVAVFGRTGSGKSSGSGAALMRSIVNDRNSALLICAAKPEERGEVRRMYREADRMDCLLEFRPGGKHCCNYLDYISKTGGGAREVAKFMAMVRETLRSCDAKGGEGDKFFEDEGNRAIYNATVVTKLATGKVTAQALQVFLSGIAQSPAQIHDPEWRKGYHCETIRKAMAARKNPMQKHDLSIAIEYFLGEMPSLNDRTRSSIMTGVYGLLHLFNTGIVREMCSGKSTFTPDDLLDGYSVLCNIPSSVHGEQGTIVNVGLKYLVQRAVLKRHAKPGDTAVGIWADEAQQVICPSFDAHYLAQCRSHLGYMIYLTQSVSGYYSAMRQAGRHQTEALLANFGHAIFHSCDPVTAEWASSKLGKTVTTFVGGSFSPQHEVYDDLFGTTKFTGSFNTSYSEILQPNAFFNLRTGGRANSNCVDGIVIRNGVPFSDGQSFKYVTWRQR
ncbi:MAG TPA: type IV secretory system conjugative DNA transfer family protein [Gemmataceae bacterium]|nr:type IV secretory system conjugative DNA transfer family protein [Gemmataceae bacterium]